MVGKSTARAAAAAVLALVAVAAGSGAAQADGASCSFYESHMGRGLLHCSMVTDFAAIPEQPGAGELFAELEPGVTATGYERLAGLDHVEYLQLNRVDARALEAMAGMEGLRHADITLADGIPLDPAVLANLDQLLTLDLHVQDAVDFTRITGMDSLEELFVTASVQDPVTARAGTVATWPAVLAPGGAVAAPRLENESRRGSVVDPASLTATSIRTLGYGTASLTFTNSYTGPAPGLPRLQRADIASLVPLHVTDTHRHWPLAMSPERPFGERPAVVGDTLSIRSRMAWPTDVQWYRDGTPIPGTSSPTYTLQPADAGRNISARYTLAQLDRWAPLVPASTVTVAYGDKIRATPARLALKGTARAGRTMTASLPADVFPRAKHAYQWYAGDEPIKGAAKPTFTLRQKDVNQRFHATVTLAGTGIETMVLISPELTAREGLITGTTPKISGKTAVGQKLTAVPGTSSPAATTTSYAWLRNGRHIGGAAGYAKTYTLAPADLGQRISVQVGYHHLDVASDTKTSAATARISAGTITASRYPSITGTKRPGRILTARTGTYSPKPTRLTYQWLANGKPVKRATSARLRLTSTLAKARISVKVTASRTGYTTRILSSKTR